MKLLFITNRGANNNDTIYSRTGRTFGLIKELQKRHEIALVVYNNSKFKRINHVLKEKNLTIYEIDYKKNRFKNYFNLYNQLNQVIKIERPDYVIYSRDLILSLFSNIISKKFKIETIFDMNDNFVSYKGIFNNFLIQEYLIFKSDKIICVSKPLERYIRAKNSKAKIYYLPSGIDRIKRVNKYDRTLIRKKLNLPLNKHILIYSGGLEKNRGIDRLIYAFKKVVTKKQNDYLIIAGDGGEYSKLISLSNKLDLNESVRFTNHLSKKELDNFLNASDIGLIPNPQNEFTKYCFPLKLMEYLSRGLNVVASDVGEIKELKPRFKNLKIFNPKKDNDFSDKIEEALNEKYNLQDLKEIRKFKWEELIKVLDFID